MICSVGKARVKAASVASNVPTAVFPVSDWVATTVASSGGEGRFTEERSPPSLAMGAGGNEGITNVFSSTTGGEIRAVGPALGAGIGTGIGGGLAVSSEKGTDNSTGGATSGRAVTGGGTTGGGIAGFGAAFRPRLTGAAAGGGGSDGVRRRKEGRLFAVCDQGTPERLVPFVLRALGFGEHVGERGADVSGESRLFVSTRSSARFCITLAASSTSNGEKIFVSSP